MLIIRQVMKAPPVCGPIVKGRGYPMEKLNQKYLYQGNQSGRGSSFRPLKAALKDAILLRQTNIDVHQQDC